MSKRSPYALPTNKSLLYPTLVWICKFSERATFLHHARKRFGRYLAVELLVFASLFLGISLVAVAPVLPRWVRIVATAIYGFRILTMAIAHVSILLLGVGKSTPGDRIHSRLRYLTLTSLNLVEVVLFGCLYLFCLQDFGQPSPYFSSQFRSLADLLFYTSNTALGFSTPGVVPTKLLSYFHCLMMQLLGVELIVVVFSIVIAIKPEDEAIIKEHELPMQDYWEWRALSFDDLGWAKNPELRLRVAQALKGKNIRSVVDIGCGVGHQARTLASQGFSVTAIDNCQAMIDIALRSRSPSITYQMGDACHLPLPDHSVNAAVMRMLLHNVIPEWRQALSEAHRVLVKNGILVVVEGFPPDEMCSAFFVDVLSRVHPRHFFATKEDLSEEIRSAGFLLEPIEKVILSGVSVRSWIENAIPNDHLKEELLRLHLQMPTEAQKGYNYRATQNDVLIDLHFALIVARSSGTP